MLCIKLDRSSPKLHTMQTDHRRSTFKNQNGNPFRNARATNKGEQSDFANFYPKIEPSSLERSEKGGKIVNLRSYAYHMVIIGSVDPEFSLLRSLLKRKELTQAEHSRRGMHDARAKLSCHVRYHGLTLDFAYFSRYIGRASTSLQK